jgi:acylphosphatase
MKKAVRVIIQGIVQGVFFRQFCKENADKLNIGGFVRNLKNGDVELILEGDSSSIEKMIEICRKGSPHSDIKKVDIEERAWQGDFKEFKILKGF